MPYFDSETAHPDSPEEEKPEHATQPEGEPTPDHEPASKANPETPTTETRHRKQWLRGLIRR